MPTQREIKRAATGYLRGSHPVVFDLHSAALTGSKLAKALRDNAWAPVSHQDKRIYVVVAYALVCLHRDNTETLAAISRSIETWKPRRADPARLFVQALHLPIDAWQDNPEQATNFYSRYAVAVRSLSRRMAIPSNELVNSGTIREWEKASATSAQPILTPVAPPSDATRFRIKYRGRKMEWTSDDDRLIDGIINSLNGRATKMPERHPSRRSR